MEFKKTGILTTESVTNITLMLAEYYDVRRNIVVPNVSWGLFWHEADLVVVTKAGYLSEIEIKRSWTDFLADFKKRRYHDDDRIARFYYAVPECMYQPVKDYLEENSHKQCISKEPEMPGIIIYRTMDEPQYRRVEIIRDPVSYKKATPLAEKDILQIARLGTLRYWSLLARKSETAKDRKIAELKSLIVEMKAEYYAATGERFRIDYY